MGDLLGNDNSQFGWMSGAWCACTESGHNIGGECVQERRPFLPDVPPALLQGQPMPLEQLTQILADPNYANFGINVYRYPADSLDPEIQFIKRNGVWIVMKYYAPMQYRPAKRTVSAQEVVRTIATFLAGENVYPSEIEILGSSASQHRVFYRVVLPPMF